MLNVAFFIFMLYDDMLIVLIFSVFMLHIVKLSLFILNAMRNCAECQYADCHCVVRHLSLVSIC